MKKGRGSRRRELKDEPPRVKVMPISYSYFSSIYCPYFSCISCSYFSSISRSYFSSISISYFSFISISYFSSISCSYSVGQLAMGVH